MTYSVILCLFFLLGCAFTALTEKINCCQSDASQILLHGGSESSGTIFAFIVPPLLSESPTLLSEMELQTMQMIFLNKISVLDLHLIRPVAIKFQSCSRLI